MLLLSFPQSRPITRFRPTRRCNWVNSSSLIAPISSCQRIQASTKTEGVLEAISKILCSMLWTSHFSKINLTHTRLSKESVSSSKPSTGRMGNATMCNWKVSRSFKLCLKFWKPSKEVQSLQPSELVHSHSETMKAVRFHLTLWRDPSIMQSSSLASTSKLDTSSSKIPLVTNGAKTASQKLRCQLMEAV